MLLEATTDHLGDTELEQLLERVYVGAGYTAPELAATLFAAASVRRRGRLLFARTPRGELAGMVIVVPPTSAMRRLASDNEAEMHLLAVDPEKRGQGWGRLLVDGSIEVARALGPLRFILWTQPAMLAAQKLYETSGFVRAEGRDWSANGRDFWVYELVLRPEGEPTHDG